MSGIIMSDVAQDRVITQVHYKKSTTCLLDNFCLLLFLFIIMLYMRWPIFTKEYILFSFSFVSEYLLYLHEIFCVSGRSGIKS